MTSAEELLVKEDAAWQAFAAQVARVPEDERERPGALEGWSVKDLVWHNGYWARFCADALERLGDGPFVDPFGDESSEHWDAENARVADESAAMTWEEVERGAGDARDHLRATVAALPSIDDDRAAMIGDETFVHYDEHAGHVAAFVDRI